MQHNIMDGRDMSQQRKGSGRTVKSISLNNSDSSVTRRIARMTDGITRFNLVGPSSSGLTQS